MRPLLITGYDDAMASVGRLTTPLMERYAYRHDMDFHCEREYKPATSPAWQKMEIVVAALRWCSPSVLWLDADVMITAPDLPPPDLLPVGICVSRDWGEDAFGPGDFSMGVFVARQESLPLFEEAMTRTEWANKPLWDQSAMREVWAECPWARNLVHVHPRRVLNPVPDDVCPGKVVDPWQPGDWLCHLTMLPFPERVQLFHEIARRLHVQ
jgi:hypothetical protein